MSGQLSNHPPLTSKRALDRLVLISLAAWAVLIAASLGQHSHDGLAAARPAPVAQAAAATAGG
jgi:hypothetical protein